MDAILPYLPATAALAVTTVVLLLISLLFRRYWEATPSQRLTGQLTLLLLTLAGALGVLLLLPIGETTKGQLLALLGILVSAAIALSSTTFVGNAMAGLMLRAVRSFKTGDFVSVGDHFGRVSERGLFHVELQTEDSDLLTLPNLYLVTNPVTVVRANGTIISATVSLGYDEEHARVSEILRHAAEAAGLRDCFVQVVDLGDFSVTYRLAGLLEEVKQILSARSRLREEMLDALHGAGIEIVSPNFMNTRALDGKRILPSKKLEASTKPADEAPPPEEVIFDKAEKAANLEALAAELQRIDKRLEELGGESSDEEPKTWEVRGLKARKDEIERVTAQAKEQED